MNHIAEIEIKQTSQGEKYIYKVDGKITRTSTRKYAFSTADGSYFSSRIDLLRKNSNYQYDLQSALHRANLTASQHAEEQRDTLRRYQKDFNKYNNEERRDEWVEHMVGILSLFGHTPSQKEIEETREQSLNHWEGWLALAKENLNKQTAFMEDDKAMHDDLLYTNERGRVRLQALDIVEYKF